MLRVLTTVEPIVCFLKLSLDLNDVAPVAYMLARPATSPTELECEEERLRPVLVPSSPSLLAVGQENSAYWTVHLFYDINT